MTRAHTAQDLIAAHEASLAEINAKIEDILLEHWVIVADLSLPLSTRLEQALTCERDLKDLAFRRTNYAETIEAMQDLLANQGDSLDSAEIIEATQGLIAMQGILDSADE